MPTDHISLSHAVVVPPFFEEEGGVCFLFRPSSFLFSSHDDTFVMGTMNGRRMMLQLCFFYFVGKESTVRTENIRN